jgi:putative phosphoesterase
VKILVIADVHGNAEALSAVLAKERDADSTVFLGDTVLPGPQPNETMELLRGLSGTLIQGKPDWLAFARWVLETLEPTGYDFLRTLQPEGEYEVDGVRLFLHHGEFPDRPKQALPDTPDDRLVTLAGGSDAPLVLFGHSHVQFRRTIDGQEFVNPGSVGQPRCGKRLACYGLIEDGVFRHCQAEYDPGPWLEAINQITPLDEFPDFREWLKQGLLSGYGIGENEPWTRYAAEGYI